jgi:protein gp37
MMRRPIGEITLSSTFADLFPIDADDLAAIKQDMEEHGYDDSAPIVLWHGHGVVVDGHTRLEAAKQAGLSTVAVFEKTFADEDAALRYAIHNQRDRRNLTNGDLLRLVAALDARRKRGNHTGNQHTGVQVEKVPEGTNSTSAAETAETIGVSEKAVHNARAVLADPAVKEQVEAGEISMTAGATKARKLKKQAADAATPATADKPKPRPTFNQTNDNIEWARWSWNPVTGCEHDCPYCYAHDIAARFMPQQGMKPTFYPDRLTAPQNTKVPAKAETDPGYRNVFVCSMADLFGAWVPQEWIDAVLQAVTEAEDWTFLFLTKNPARMVGIDWPQNAWVGTTVDTQERVDAAVAAFQQIEATTKFLSCEPLRSELVFPTMECFDWVIVGGQSEARGCRAAQPEWAWVESLWLQVRAANLKLYFKPNLTVRPREYPEW